MSDQPLLRQASVAELVDFYRDVYKRQGYVKIIDGILLAAKIFREGKIPAASADDWQVGNRVHRLDVEEKVLRCV